MVLHICPERLYLNVLSAQSSQVSQKNLLENEAASAKGVASKACLASDPVIFCKSGETGSETIEGTHPNQKQLTPVKH